MQHCFPHRFTKLFPTIMLLLKITCRSSLNALIKCSVNQTFPEVRFKGNQELIFRCNAMSHDDSCTPEQRRAIRKNTDPEGAYLLRDQYMRTILAKSVYIERRYSFPRTLKLQGCTGSPHGYPGPRNEANHKHPYPARNASGLTVS